MTTTNKVEKIVIERKNDRATFWGVSHSRPVGCWDLPSGLDRAGVKLFAVRVLENLGETDAASIEIEFAEDRDAD